MHNALSLAAVESPLEALPMFVGAEEPVSAIRRDGSIDARFDPGLSDARLVTLYEHMLHARLLDERLMSLQRQGRVGFHIGSSGEEAAILGSALMLDEQDWVFPSYREQSVAILRGLTLKELLDHMVANGADFARGRQMPSHFTFARGRMVSISSPVGTQITQAVGFAWAARQEHDRAAVIAYFGEGTTSSGEFHAALNFAGVMRAPAVFLCRNNGWAISTPVHAQTASQTFAEKGTGYGMLALRCDGNDALAVAWATRTALERARAGDGPTLIEAVTYRLGPHSSSDDARAYRSEQEVQAVRAKDPLVRMRALLTRRGLWSDAQEAELESSFVREFKAALSAAEAEKPPHPDTLFDDVYAELPPHLHAQREALRQALSGEVESPHAQHHSRP